MSSASKIESELRENHSRQNWTTASLPTIRKPSGGGEVFSKMVSSVNKEFNTSASCLLKASLNWSTIVRVSSDVIYQAPGPGMERVWLNVYSPTTCSLPSSSKLIRRM